MKKYPKVPRHDLDFVPQDVFSADDLVLLEKMDGMNFRFTLYEDRFRDEYPDSIINQNPDDGDLVFGTKSVIRGCVEEPISNYAPELHPGIKSIQDVDKNKISSYQNKYGPMIWYAENMVPHTLDYEYESNPPPNLIGFDVYVPRNDPRTDDEFDPNPYKERFVGYLDYKTAKQLFNDIGIDFSPIIAEIQDFNGLFNPDEFEIPISKFANVQAEGVVIRSDSLEIRTKYVRESFREMHKSAMGGHSNKHEEPENWIIDALITPSRIRKHVRKLVNNQGYEFSTEQAFVDVVSQKVLSDAWSEEFAEIREIKSEMKPSETHKPTNEKVASVLERMKQMSARTGEKPENAWLMLDDDLTATKNPDPELNNKDLMELETEVNERLRNGKSSEEALIEIIIGEDKIKTVIDDISKDKDIGGWAVKPATDKLEDIFWTGGNASVLWRLHISFTPSKIRQKIIEKVKEYIESETGVDLDRGGGSWEPDNQEFSFKGFDGF